MRPAALKLMGLALAAVVAFVAAPSINAGPFEDCVQECVDQWEADKAECEVALTTRLAELDAQEQACIIDNQGNLIATGLCVRDVNIRRANAQRDYQRCISFANTAAYNCYRGCQVSPGQP
ncbi:MAG: hypothetical protein HC882_02885 [Acidobacteria bacterium]|nr:hypothetical protein [Acidobacteriota bacterium]